MTIYRWTKGNVPSNLEIKQVYGIAFDDYGRILLRTDDNEYKLTGGKPEPYDNSIEETLKREFLEEANTELENIYMLGYQYVDEKNGIKPYAQVRMIAKIKSIGKNRPDLDTGKMYKRFMAIPENTKEYLKWGKIGNQQIDDGVELAKEKYGLMINCESEDFI